VIEQRGMLLNLLAVHNDQSTTLLRVKTQPLRD